MIKIIHETGEETAASEAEPDVEGDLIHTLKESLTVSQTMCFVFNYKTADCTRFRVLWQVL